VLIDRSTTVDGSDAESNPINSNIEKSETFQVYFLDGSASAVTGGQENVEEFKDLIRQLKQGSFDIEFQCDLQREAVSDFKDNNLVNACLLQFLYGRGGMHKLRLKGNGSFTTKVDTNDYVEHLSRLSQPQFQMSLFNLILYNISMKQMMVKAAGFRVRSNATAAALATQLTADDLDRALDDHRNGNNTESNSPAHTFLRAINATMQAAPHTNKAAK
jgi:hypothetical protein